MPREVPVAAVPSVFSLILFREQARSKQNINRRGIREAFSVYCQSPSSDNANKLLALMPKEPDYGTIDVDQKHATTDLIYGRGMDFLGTFVRRGDRSALRITYRMLIISDGALAEDLLNTIGEAIRPAPLVFLEEAKFFSEYEKDWKLWLKGIGFPGDYLPSDVTETANKELLLRIQALERVTRPDWLAMRDYFLGPMKEERAKHESELGTYVSKTEGIY